MEFHVLDDGTSVPVFDARDVEVFIALAHISAVLEVARRAPDLLTSEAALSSSDRHWLEEGHRLRWGCCRNGLEDGGAQRRREAF